MTDTEQREAARQFYYKWNNKGQEDEDDRSYWLDLLSRVLGVDDATDRIQFQKKVIVDGSTKRIDAYIPETKVLIEQKSLGVNLDKEYRQSDGAMRTPYEQAKNYSNNLTFDERARWIVVSNFSEIRIHDMNIKRPERDFISIELRDIQSQYFRLEFLVKRADKIATEQVRISFDAGRIVGKIYDALLKQYADQTDPESLKSLNKLCVRLVFCFYAEDSGLFGNHMMFHDYMEQFDAKAWRAALIALFKVLDTEPEKRDRYIEDDLAAFPYVNGGLFADENIEIPRFTDEIVSLILNDGCGFDWAQINSTIFGAVFESTLNPETRRSGGMHYTSVENIHKVIDPLFLDDLKNELAEIKAVTVVNTRKKKLAAYQNKLAELVFFDPACGSGNFLTETYLSLRRLENEVIAAINDDNIVLVETNPIKVSISQFYGIEINDFAVTVAQSALWIAESQMMKETESVVNMQLDFLPLKTNAHIVEGNALRTDWESVVPKERLNYIMGNPPFAGGMYMSDIQKKEIRDHFKDVKGAGELDYVTGWYKMAVEYLKGTSIRCAFVSTNSICQGSQVITFWKYLLQNYAVCIDFAYPTFVWNSEASDQAKVHCVIVGFSDKNNKTQKKLFTDENHFDICEQISPYLTNTPVIFVDSRSKPICNVPLMRFGSMPRDGGGFVLSPEERKELIKKEPLSQKWIRPYVGATEFLNNKERYCLWLVEADPGEINRCTIVKKRVEFVRKTRASSKAAGTRKFAETPTLFCQIAQPDSDYIIVPKTSSGRRRYIPMGFMDKTTIASDLVFLIPDAGLYEFGILMSNVHNSWMRLVAGRLKSDYRYSKDIVYNNFPWPTPTDAQRKAIENTAQAILDARALYPDSSLADLYDDLTMPLELRRAHQNNDRAVMTAYGFSIKDMSESDCVAALMRMYQQLTENLN